MSVIIDGSSWVLVSDGAAYEILEELDSEEVVEILVPGPPGPAGVGLNGSVFTAGFSYGDATPSPLLTVPSGKHVYHVRLFIEVPFDGVGAALSVGSVANPQELLATNENDPGQAGTYLVHPDKKYVGATAVLLTIVPGLGASAGAGQLQIDIEP